MELAHHLLVSRWPMFGHTATLAVNGGTDLCTCRLQRARASWLARTWNVKTRDAHDVNRIGMA